MTMNFISDIQESFSGIHPSYSNYITIRYQNPKDNSSYDCKKVVTYIIGKIELSIDLKI